MWTAEDVKKARQGSGKWTADMVKNIRAGNKVNINDPINQLSPLERDRAEQARRSKMGTTKNMTPEVKTSVTPKTTANNVLGLGIIAPRPEVLETGKKGLDEAAKIAKGVVTDPLGTLERIDQSQFGKDIMAGVGQANKSTANVLKSIGGDKVPIVKDALSGIDKMSDPLIQQGGKGILSQVTQSLPRAASNMGLAFLSGGASVPAQLGGNATLQAVKQTLTSPTFANSMLQSYGGAYGQAREEGANRPQAITKAVLQAFPEALIEQAGGVEQLPANMAKQSLLKTIGKSALEEGMEEVFQYPFEALARKATYAPNTPFYSMTENAVINPKDMAQGALVGGLAGGLLGGGAKAVTGDVSLPRFKQQTPIQAEQQTRPMPIPKKPDFYTDTYGNTSTDINASRQMPQAPSMLPEAPQTQQQATREVLSTDSSTGEIFKQGDYVYKNTTRSGWKQNRATPQPTIEAEVYETLKGNDNILDGELVDYEGEQKIKTPYVKNIVSIDTVPKGKRESIGRNIISKNYSNIVEAVQALSDAGYSYSDPLQFGYHNGKLKLMDFSNASKTDTKTATADNYAALNSFFNAFGLDGYAKITSDGMRILDDLQTYTTDEIINGDMLAEPEHIVIVQQAARTGIKPNNVYFTRNARMVQTKTPIGQTENVNGVAYVFSESPLSPAEISDWELTPIYQQATQTQQAQQQAAPTIESQKPRQESEILQKRRQAELLRKEYEQIKATSKLTPDELTIADNIRKGKLSAVPQGFNTQIINEVANAGRLYDQAEGEVKAFNETRKQLLRDTMDGLLEGSDNAKDKSGAFLSREIQERNSIDVFGEETGKKINETIFRPVHDNEAKKTRFINKYVGRAKSMNLSKAESQAVQMLGEGKIAEHELPANMDKAKIKNAVSEFRKIYDGLLSLANEVLVNNGYAPVEYRKDYFPHFEDPKDPFVKAMKNLGFKVDNITLPTDIAGITHQFRPGKKWFGNFLRREGTNTTYDALEGFERYLYGISDVIYHTNDIQRLRAFETAIRSKYAPDNIKNRIAEIEQSGLSQEEQQAAIDELFSVDKGHLGSYVTNLREYTDNLAGKKSISDRGWEHKLRRNFYNFLDNTNTQVARNMVGFNVSSWLTNFIPLAQAGAGIKTKNFIKAANDTVLNYYKDDGFINKSTFLTNRKGTERLTRTTVQKIADAGMAPMQLIDEFTSQILVRGKYLEGIESGLSHKEAMQKADSYVAGAMADRSKGSMPTAFNVKNPLTKLFTMFQLEVNNQFSFLFKDIPREAKEKGGKWLAATLLKFMVGSFLYNELYEKLTGRRPTIDPIGTIKRAIESEAPLASIGKDVMEQTPFVGGILPSALGISQGGGRLPIGAALPDFQQIGGAAKNIKENGWSLENAVDLASGALKNPATYLLSPFGGGGQAKKAIEGLKAFGQGASLSDTGRMRYPIPKTPFNALRTGLFGQYSTPEAREYFDKNRSTLSPNQTQQVMSSEDPQQAYLQIMQQRQINSLSQKIKDIAADDTLSRAEKDKKITEIRQKINELRN